MLSSRCNRPVPLHLMSVCVASLAVLVNCGVSNPAHAQASSERPKVMIVLDASGSMRAKMDGRTRMDIAKDTLSTVLSEMPGEVDIGLIAYGHRERGSCTDIETIVRSGPARQSVPQILGLGRSLTPLGKTPLTQAVRQAAEELKYTEDKATVILITDGIETCEADPCALGRELAREGVGFTAHVVGFGMTQQEGRQVACLAENTGGKYVPANNADELTGALRDLVNAEPEPEPEPVIQGRPVHFTWRDTNGGPHLNSRAFQMVIRPLDGGEAPDNIRLWHHERPYSAEASMMPGRYVALVQRLEDRRRTINARIEFEVPPGDGPFMVDRVITARLRIDGVLTANGDVKTGNLHAAHGGSDPRFEFTLYPVEDGAVSLADRFGFIHSSEVALSPGLYLVHGSAPGFRREQLVNVPAGETTVMRFDFDLAEVFIDFDDRDGLQRRRPLDLVFESMEGTTWSNQKHVVEGRGTKNNRPAPYLLPRGLWRIKSYDEGSPRPVAETIIEVTGSAQPIHLKLRDGQTPDPQMLSRFVEGTRIGCIQRVGGGSPCLVAAVTPEQVDQSSGVDPAAADRETARASFDGTWMTTQGTITLVREGRRIVGEWKSSNQNRIEARLSGDLRTIRGTWATLEGQSSGMFEARLSDDGKTFSGNWNSNEKLPTGSRWQGRRVSYGTPELRDNPKDASRFPDRLVNSSAFQNFISEIESQPDQIAPAPQRRGDSRPSHSETTTVAGGGTSAPAQAGGWLTPQRPAESEPPGMSCDDLKNKVAEIMFSTNVAVQQHVIGVGEREGFAGGPPSDPADCARLARAFAIAGIAGFDVSGPGDVPDASPLERMPSPTPQQSQQTEQTQPADGPPFALPVDTAPALPGRRETIGGVWSLERTGFKAVVTVKRQEGPPPVGSYQPYDIEMRVESRPGDGCPKEPAWQAICRNVHQYGAYVGNGDVSAGAVVPSNTGRYLRGQLVGDVMLPIQISLDRGWLWVSLPKGEMWGEEPDGPAGWYNLRFAASDDASRRSDGAGAPQPQPGTMPPATAPEFPGTTIWAIVDNEMDISRVSNADRVERCRRDPRIGFGNGILVHRRENPNWQPGQKPAPGNPGPFLTLNVRECDRSGDMLECLEKPISPLNGQPMTEAARILQFRLEPHTQSGGIRGCPVNSGHMVGGKQCGIYLPCDESELDVAGPEGNLLALITAPVAGYDDRRASNQMPAATRSSSETTNADGSGGSWGCQLVFGHVMGFEQRTRDDQAFGQRLMSALTSSGLMDTVRTWREEPPVDQAACNEVAQVLAASGIDPFNRSDAPNISTCADFRAIADHLPKYRDLPGFEMTDAQSQAAFGLIRQEWGNADPTDTQCQAMAEKWRGLKIPGFAHADAAPGTPMAEPQRAGDAGSMAAGGIWSCLYVNGQISVVNDGALRSGPTRNEALFEKVMRTLTSKGFMHADQAWGGNPPTDQETCNRLGSAMSEAQIPGFERPNSGTVASCQDLRAIGFAIRNSWDKFGLTAEQYRGALDHPKSPTEPGLSQTECRAIAADWVRLGIPISTGSDAAPAPPPKPATSPQPDQKASAANARAVQIVENLYGEHIRRSKLGGSVLDEVELATKWGFARPVATALVKNLARIGSDPIFDAQDFDITELSVTLDPKPAQAGRIAVLAKFRNFGQPTQVRYLLEDAGTGPEIVDIEGKGWQLRKLLRLGR